MKTLGVTLRVAVALLLGGPIFNAAADTVTFTSDSSLGLADHSVDSQDIIVTNCTLTVDGAHTFNSIQIQNSGVLTHSADTNGPFQGFNLTVTHDAQVASGGAINISGKGYAGGVGNGAGASQMTNFPFTFTAGGGGAHGGSGGMSTTFAAGGGAYDSTPSPGNLGSGGGTGTASGGAGGGLAQLTVGGTLQVDGQIVADGLKGTNAHSGGGAGGGISLSALTISGAGSISANGGAGDVPDGGGGGGGRIAISSTTNTFTGTMTAFGGSGAMYGGAGTIYILTFDDGFLPGHLLIDNGGNRGASTLFSVQIVSNLVVSGGAVAQAQSTNLPVMNLFVGSNSSLIPSAASTLTISVNGDATVETNAALNADAWSSTGPGAGHGNLTLCTAGSGGGYGGVGGASACGTAGGIIYGSLTQPNSLGSPGGANPLARGGGAIIMTVQGTLSLAGNISANGAPATQIPNGGGSGGSVWLTVGTLTGGGNISANGGSASNSVSGGGGGGRVAIYFSTNQFTGNVTAHGGSGINAGGPGTVYLLDTNTSYAKIIVDNGGSPGFSTVPVTISQADVTISGGAIVTNIGLSAAAVGNWFVGSNSSFVLMPASNPTMFLNATNLTVQAGGGIIADGVETSGSGMGQSLSSTGGGGGNGGIGGASASGAGGGVLQGGSTTAPASFGGPGGGGQTGPGGSGGGILRIIAQNLQLDGTLSANGFSGTAINSGGGAGGSVNLNVVTLSGAGTVTANGGAGNNLIGGGGGGGRVAILYTSNLFTGALMARGGAGANYGGAGTVYTARDSFQQLFIDNGGNRGASTILGSVSGLFNLSITGGALVSNTSSSSLNLGNLLVGSNSVYLGYPSAPNQLMVFTNATVQAGAVLSVDGVNTAGPAPGQNLNGTGGGGTYGGVGGISSTNATGGFPFNDSISGPTSMGSRGGAGLQQVNGGSGGGGWHITVNGKLQLDGKISAEGVGNPNSPGSGGGSGGSIWIIAGGLSGAGAISANGGSANFTGSIGGGGGGGGRIAISCTTNTFSGTLTAFGGPGANFGGAGTIFVNPSTFGTALSSQLTVDNGGAAGNTLISQFPLSGFSLTVAGRATLLATNSSSLTVQNFLIGSNSTFIPNPQNSQTMLVLSNATIQPGGKFTADGQSTGTASGGQTLNSTGGGGGHGGYGGSSLSNALGGVVTSDDLAGPVGGSRGGAGFGGVLGGNGGGVVRLTVNGTLQLDGRFSADGAASAAFNGGGGSGGGAAFSAGRLLGAGAISANGGAGNNVGGGGGGGRISISYKTNLFTGSITVRGGAGGNAGGAGTILYSSFLAGGNGPVKLIVDNGGVRGTNTFLPTPPRSVDVVISNGAAVTVPNTSITWLSLLISSNATLGVVTNSGSTPTSLIMNITSNLTVQAGGAIQLDGAGFGANNGAGSGGLFSGNGGGGGHGGLGSAGTVASAHGGAAYDSILTPTSAGSGGGASNPGPGYPAGSAGGGTAQLMVGRILSVDGTFTANGLAGVVNGGGGAGGGMYLRAAGLAGAGVISANGGDAAAFSASGGGGGGRIAIYFNSNNFAGTLSAHGGAGWAQAGGAGTIYLKTNQNAIAQILLDNSGVAGTNTPLDSAGQSVALTVRNGAAASSAIPLTFQNVTIGAGGLFNANPLTPLNLTVLSDAVVQPGGGIIADADGYGPTNGPGYGSVDFFGDGSGGGYGGAGGASAFEAPGGVTYGSSNQPVDFGSPGGMIPALANYSQGGGVIRMQVNGHLILDGIVSAEGSGGIIDGSGGGSGGSIWISAPTISGTGSLTANGGDGESTEGGGGGGGRIAIYTGTNLFGGNATAAGGDGAASGQTGTIVIRTNILVSGSVTDTNGVAIVGITLQPSGLNSVITDTNGTYSVTVPFFWNGSITPLGNYFFIPNVRTYSNLAANSDSQNFLVADPAAFNIGAGQFDGTNVGFNWFGINGVTYQVQSSTNLVDWAAYGPPILGGGSPSSISLPVTDSPQLFFRLSVSY